MIAFFRVFFGSLLGGGAEALVTWPLVGRVFLIAIGIGLIGGLYPGIKAAAVRPVVVLKGE